jgi:hypothetical protein
MQPAAARTMALQVNRKIAERRDKVEVEAIVAWLRERALDIIY